MSELVIKIGPGANYEDNDILEAFSPRRIAQAHAEHICFPKQGRESRRLVAMDGNGIMLPDSPVTALARGFCEATHELRLERLSKTEGRIIRVADGAEIRFTSNQPFQQFDGDTVAMDLDLYCLRKRRANHFPVFGSYGREIIYSGRLNFAAERISAVWAMIEARTGKRPGDNEHRYWPAGQQDLCSHLFIPADDFDDEAAAAMLAPILDTSDPENPRIVKKRAIRCNNWRGLLARLGVSQADVENPGKSVDRRRDVEPFARGQRLLDKRTGPPAQPPGPPIVPGPNAKG